MTSKLQAARQLFMAGHLSQKDIAAKVGITERTLYNWMKRSGWEKLKQAAYEAPALIAQSLCSQLVELQNTIAQREPGKRFPTLQESEITRRLITCIEKMKKYPSLSVSMQAIETFRQHMMPLSTEFAGLIGQYATHYFDAIAQNGFEPFELEYGIRKEPTFNPFLEDAPAGDIAESSDFYEPEISTESKRQTIDTKGDGPLPLHHRQPEKTENFNASAPGHSAPQQQSQATPPPSRSVPTPKQGRNEPCACKSGKKFKHCHGR